jgi:transmembrane sensor
MEEFILRVLRGEASRFEEERLKQWRAEDPTHEAEVQALARIWEITTPEAVAEADPAEVERLAESIVMAAEARRRKAGFNGNADPRRRRAGLRPGTILPWGAALAASAAALALGLRSANTRTQELLNPSVPVSTSLTSRTLRLDDGSFVRLSPGSRLEASLGMDRRTVTLEGRGFFAVAPQKGRPFVVHTPAGQVSVLGTRFEVSQQASDLRTVVVEGRVALATPEGQVEVPAGNVGFAQPGSRPTVTEVEDVLALLDWPGGLLVYHNTALDEVAREVERHFRVPIRVEPRGRNMPRVSASFEDEESFTEILETLCSVTRSECRISPDSAVIGHRTGETR